jgi:hypothetical protein
MTHRIELTKGKVAFVDDIDHHWLTQIKWYFQEPGYAGSDLFGGRKTKVKVLMHRLILLAPASATVDHINHDTLDNRRCNLRLATQSQQNGNRLSFFGSSRFKGVHRRQDGRKWVAQCHHIHLGSFESEVDAARAYNKEARSYWGKFALLNDIGDESHGQ